MTLPAYLALLDTLLRAAALEDAKAADGPDAMVRWAAVAVPRWQAVSAQLIAAEAAYPAETWGWYLAWRDEQHRAGRWKYPRSQETIEAKEIPQWEQIRL